MERDTKNIERRDVMKRFLSVLLVVFVMACCSSCKDNKTNESKYGWNEMFENSKLEDTLHEDVLVEDIITEDIIVEDRR